MASYLTQCTGVCGRVIRTMRAPTEPVLCDSCRPVEKAEQGRVRREVAPRATQKRAGARAADKEEQ